MGLSGFSADYRGLCHGGRNAIVVEDAMNPSASHFAHGAVSENRGVFEWNVSLIIEPVCDPTAHCFRRKAAFIHREVERMFIVISTHTNRAQFFDERFAVPKSGGHKHIPDHAHVRNRKRKLSSKRMSTITR